MRAAGKRISIFLAVCLLFQFGGFPAFAEEPEEPALASITVSVAPSDSAPVEQVDTASDRGGGTDGGARTLRHGDPSAAL